MAAGVLNDVSLAYQLLWNAQRQPDQVWLHLEPLAARPVNASHLVSALSRQWSTPHVTLTLSSADTSLLMGLLDQTPPALAQVAVEERLLSDPTMAQRLMHARQRGLQLVWRGEPGTQPQPDLTHNFTQTLLSLSADDALQHLRLLRSQSKTGTQASRTVDSFAADTLLEGVANAGLLDYFLDQQGARALMGWPSEDVLFACRPPRAQPGWQAVKALIQLIQADAAMDDVARALSQEPLLVYRFLRYANSAGLGLNREITALRHGLMVLGLVRLKNWLQDQLPHASKNLNLQPIASLMVMRARFMTELLDAGAAIALQDELALCGLLSQMDLLTGETLQQTLHPIPLPERVHAALLGNSGPYWPYLDVAMALDSGQAQATHEACLRHGFDEESVNLALLRTLNAQCADTTGLARPQATSASAPKSPTRSPRPALTS